jgi:salicylate hydroxylase
MALEITILGAGITGLTSALALQKSCPKPKPEITIFEVRNEPSTIGGAINLTPKALRYLQYLGVDARNLGAECRKIQLFDLYNGSNMGEVDFQGPEGQGIGSDESKRFFSARVMRSDLQAALLEVLEEQTDIKIIWGKKAQQIEESKDHVRLLFNDGSEVKSDVLLGCDGIHSGTRTLLIEPQRQPTYTGISVVMATATLPPDITLRWQTTGLASSRRGSFMASYYERTRQKQYITAVM